MTVTRADTPLRRFVADYLTSPLAVGRAGAGGYRPTCGLCWADFAAEPL